MRVVPEPSARVTRGRNPTKSVCNCHCSALSKKHSLQQELESLQRRAKPQNWTHDSDRIRDVLQLVAAVKAPCAVVLV